MKANTHRYGSGHRFGGGTDTVTNEEFTLPSSWRTQRLMHGVHWRGAVTAVAILFILVCHLHAQVTPPPVSLFHTSTGPIAGGVTVGADGVTYFTTLKSGANNARVTALNPDGTVKWTFQPLVGGVSYNLWPLPVLEPDENTLLIGSDAGVFYRLYATSGSEWWSYSVDAPSGTDKKIRSTAAFNANYGSAYFHCNDGFLYAIKAFTGTLRWKKATGNNLGNPPSQGGPPPVDILHPEPWSSSPVIGADHTVYVGSADGKVYAFTSSGGNKWPGPVNLGAPIEATIAIGQDGWLYVGTRASPGGAGLLFAINPAKAAVDPAQAIEWSAAVGSQEPGIIASAVIDQGGFVYCADYNDIIIKFHPKAAPPPDPPFTGLDLRTWGFPGKFCQTPSLTQNGLLIVGTSTDDATNPARQFKRAIRAFHIDKDDTPYWTVPQVDGQDVGDFLGSPAIICSSVGTTYIADLDMPTGAGRLYKFDSGSTLMAGDWPTFQTGSRRIGKVKT